MAKRLLESLRGTGTVHAGDRPIRTTSYELSVWSDDGPDPEAVSGIDGHIDITGIGEAAVLAGSDILILTIEDGRRLAFQLTSSVGGLVSKGWLP